MTTKEIGHIDSGKTIELISMAKARTLQTFWALSLWRGVDEHITWSFLRTVARSQRYTTGERSACTIVFVYYPCLLTEFSVREGLLAYHRNVTT